MDKQWEDEKKRTGWLPISSIIIIIIIWKITIIIIALYKKEKKSVWKTNIKKWVKELTNNKIYPY